jgi:hypothetical protein
MLAGVPGSVRLDTFAEYVGLRKCHVIVGSHVRFDLLSLVGSRSNLTLNPAGERASDNCSGSPRSQVKVLDLSGAAERPVGPIKSGAGATAGRRDGPAAARRRRRQWAYQPDARPPRRSGHRVEPAAALLAFAVAAESAPCRHELAAGGQLRGRGGAGDLGLERGKLLVHLGVRACLVELVLDVVGVTADIFENAGLE